ncbi:MAG: hypothetical protein ACLPTB_11830 [Acidimicrobiales bacterium]
MSRALFVLVVMLGLPGFLPALAAVRRSPALFFLAPLIGAAMAAVAVEFELGVGGSLLMWYVVLSVLTNVAVIAWWWVVGGSSTQPAGPSWAWLALTVVVVGGAMVVPMTGLRTLMFGRDANSIWLTHSLMIAGGHQVLLADMRNSAYAFSNLDYPPLASAAGALAFARFGLARLHLAVDVTALLTACALGVAGASLATVTERGRPFLRVAGIVVAAAVCMAGFSLAADSAVDGRADLLWSAAALGAIICGLVLPQSKRSLVLAWICAIVASLTKNEGLTTALIVLVLIAFRYRPLSWRRQLPAHAESHARPRRRLSPTVRSWAERAAFVVLPALPGLAWLLLVHLLGVRDRFFGQHSGETPGLRAGATLNSILPHLVIVPIALAVLVVGGVFFHRARGGAGLGNPGWLWVVCLSYLAVLLATYVVGAYEIHWWLKTSAARTTIFPQLALYADLGIWLIIALDASGQLRGGGRLDAGGRLAAGGLDAGGLDAGGPLDAAGLDAGGRLDAAGRLSAGEGPGGGQPRPAAAVKIGASTQDEQETKWRS